MVRAVSQKFGKDIGRKLSNRLITESPNLKPKKFKVLDKDFAYFEEKFSPSVDYINKFLPTGEQITLSQPEEDLKNTTYSVREDEFASIAEVFGSMLQKREKTSAHKFGGWPPTKNRENVSQYWLVKNNSPTPLASRLSVLLPDKIRGVFEKVFQKPRNK